MLCTFVEEARKAKERERERGETKINFENGFYICFDQKCTLATH